MILLWGLPGDRPLASVCAALKRLGAPFLFLDQRAALETEIELCVDGDVCGELRYEGRSLDLAQVAAVYARPYDSRRLPLAQGGSDAPAYRYALGLEDLLSSFCDLTPALVVNRPAAMAMNNSKPYQAERIRSLGFRVPATLVTTDPEAVLEFWHQHGEVVYKSVSGVRSVVARLTEGRVARLENVRFCPTQFQEYISGEDVRVHVVGDDVFACCVASTADDYRYPGPDDGVRITPLELPSHINGRCRDLARTMGLPVAGIDLRRSRDGEWYCFEVNPSPGFSYYEQETGQPIHLVLARLLASEIMGEHHRSRGELDEDTKGS